jgi:hypothetical protein
MSYAISIPPGGAGEGGGGTTDPPDPGTLTIASDETTVDFSRPTGALKFVVTNAGPAAGGNAATATVNGVNLFPGDRLTFEAKLDPVNNVFLTLPLMTIVTNGATIWWYEER